MLSDAGYPYQSPTVKFTTPCFHPNVDSHGNICLDILKEKWSALYEVDLEDCELSSLQLCNVTLNCLSGSNDPTFHPVSVGWEEIILEYSKFERYWNLFSSQERKNILETYAHHKVNPTMTVLWTLMLQSCGQTRCLENQTHHYKRLQLYHCLDNIPCRYWNLTFSGSVQEIPAGEVWKRSKGCWGLAASTRKLGKIETIGWEDSPPGG